MFNARQTNMNVHRKKIIDYIEKERVVTSSDVARFLHVSWNTADSYLKELLIEGKVIRMKKTGVTLWTKK